VDQVLNTPLSGAEIQEVIVNRIREALRRDQRLLPYMAFAAFSFKANIAIVLGGTNNATLGQGIDTSVVGQAGPEIDPNAEDSDVTVVHAEQSEATPNQVRIDNDLPVTVLSKDHAGRPVERKVKYGKDRKAIGEVKDESTQPPIHGNAVVPGAGR
jgi:hypothetical protein